MVVSLSTETAMPKFSDHGICIIQVSYISAELAFLLFFTDQEIVLADVLHIVG